MISGGLGLISCDKDEEEFPVIEMPNISDESNFFMLNVKDTTGLVCLNGREISSDTSLVCLGGTRNGNIWFGVFNKDTKDQIYECSTDIKLKRTITKDIGYGESLTFEVNTMQMAGSDYLDNKLVTSIYLMKNNTDNN